MQRFATLLRREWMQHHRGYLALAVAPPVLLLLVMAFVPGVQVQPKIPDVVMAIATLAFTGMVLAIVWGAMAFQLPGLARRDQQDRSIEFWVSLPVSHSASVGATLLFHALLMPLMALGIGWAFSQVLGLVMVAMVAGAGAWGSLPWGWLLADSAVLLLRLALGVTLATLWLSPILMLLMVASAGLKRWGVPVVLAGTGVAALVLKQGFQIGVIGQTLKTLLTYAAAAFVGNAERPPKIQPGDDPSATLRLALERFPHLAADTAWQALADLATPAFVGAMAVSVACFFALVALRRRNG